MHLKYFPPVFKKESRFSISVSEKITRHLDPQILRIFKETRGRIQSMALIHEMLYKTGDLWGLDLKDYLEHLARSVVGSYTAAKIGLNPDPDSVPVSLDIAMPCGLILNELLSNSLKHAFPAGGGEIGISLRTRGNQLGPACSDNGVGFPEGFQIERASPWE
ncbi:MAG: sensor histidine kinase [Nitrospiraceae bacterium]|nr:sensor histidine kinase [Nitrospiraceae bacterium]